MRALRYLWIVAFAAGCEKTIPAADDGPLSFDVRVTSGNPGTAESPLPFSHDPFSLTLSVGAIDRDGQPATWFEGPLHLRLAPYGKLADGQASTVSMAGGVADGIAVQMYDVHATSNLWVEAVGTDDAPGNYATGLSPAIVAADPTIRQIQEVETSDTLPTWETSPLAGDFVLVEMTGRTVVVTGVFSDGCYVTDTTEGGLTYDSIFVYNHSRPMVEVGDRVVSLSGTNDEYFGFTELSFPTWKVEGTAAVPSPVLIDAANVDDSNALEMAESALVEVEDVVVCPVDDNYATYGQWAVLVDPASSCTAATGKINVVSASTASEFNPALYEGATLTSVRGNLRYHSAADPTWMIYVRSVEDIAAATAE
jgi:hypothetical protein